MGLSLQAVAIFHFIVSGTIIAGLLITAVFFAYLTAVINEREFVRYLTPRKVRKRITTLKVAELENKIEFELLKRDKLLALREGNGTKEAAEEAISKVERGREITTGEKPSRY